MKTTLDDSAGWLICLGVTQKLLNAEMSWFGENIVRECGISADESILNSECPIQARFTRMKSVGSIDWQRSNLVSQGRLILRLPGGSHSIFEWQTTPRVEIPSSVVEISQTEFLRAKSLKRVVYDMPCHPQKIDGFRECKSLHRIEIPSSVELIASCAFGKCASLIEVVFASNCHVRHLKGFSECIALHRIELPS
jgi:hypothetical protein